MTVCWVRFQRTTDTERGQQTDRRHRGRKTDKRREGEHEEEQRKRTPKTGKCTCIYVHARRTTGVPVGVDWEEKNKDVDRLDDSPLTVKSFFKNWKGWRLRRVECGGLKELFLISRPVWLHRQLSLRQVSLNSWTSRRMSSRHLSLDIDDVWREIEGLSVTA